MMRVVCARGTHICTKISCVCTQILDFASEDSPRATQLVKGVYFVSWHIRENLAVILKVLQNRRRQALREIEVQLLSAQLSP